MSKAKLFLSLGLTVILAGATAGCGGGAPAGGSGGAAGNGGSPAASGPAWGGSGAWSNLTKLTNYSFQTSVAMGGATMTINDEQHDPGNYQMTIDQGGQNMTFILAGGHNYMGSPSGYVDLGAATSKSSSSGLQDAASTWQGFLGGNGASYAGPCSVAGRSGNSFDLKVDSSMLGTAIIGSATGNACVDTTSGVLLSSTIKWTAAGGQTFADTFQLTGMGNVPVIPVPTGAASIPSGH